ncbi:peptidase S8/S53 domain-containing protein [Flagelloscypha sp. PMI_526]|nr:peptidase S8/S53 domain-containing protein [Flagelloscypha sp. PMI_526]
MEIVDAAMEVIFKDFQSHYSPETHFGVINLSFDLLHRARASSDPWLDKMTHAKKLGMIFVNSASNNAKNRCFEDQKKIDPSQTSPPKTYEIIVGASNEFNEVSSFSNRGSCVDLWAPGSRIRAALKGGLYSESDGTSNSAAFVAGMIAYTKSCLLGPNDKATRDVFVDMFTRERIPVLEPLASVIQNAQPWLAKLPITLATNHAENSHVQAPMESHAFVQKALWHLIAVTSRNQNYITKQRKSEWEFDPGLLEPETDGNGVTVYLLDSGVDFNHPDFSHTSHIEAGYAINIPEVQNGNTDARKDSSNAGHGTRMASLILGRNGGVSPYATLFPIKGTIVTRWTKIAPNFMHRIYAGIRMAINHFKTVAKVKKGVISINWPLFYDHENDNKWKDLIKEADAAGLIVVVPAGDNGEDRCFIINAKPVVGKTRPPKSKEFVVGASTEWNQDATFSNRGACVDVWAPGTRITAAAPSFGPHDARYAVQDGTEHSSAIVTSIIAGILSKQTKPTWASVFVELISKKAMVDVCKGCLLDGQPFLVKHAGKLAYPKKIT